MEVKVDKADGWMKRIKTGQEYGMGAVGYGWSNPHPKPLRSFGATPDPNYPSPTRPSTNQVCVSPFVSPYNTKSPPVTSSPS